MKKALIKIALWTLRRLKASPLELDVHTGFWHGGELYYIMMTTLECNEWSRRKLTIEAYTHKED